MNKEKIESWKQGYKAGEESVFQFLEEIEKIPWIKEIKKEYKAWSNADEYTKLNGEVVKRYELDEKSKQAIQESKKLNKESEKLLERTRGLYD